MAIYRASGRSLLRAATSKHSSALSIFQPSSATTDPICVTMLPMANTQHTYCRGDLQRVFRVFVEDQEFEPTCRLRKDVVCLIPLAVAGSRGCLLYQR